MKKETKEDLFARWREGDPLAWVELKPHLMLNLRRTRPALNLPPEHLSTIQNLLCLRLDLAEENELRALPGDQYWEFYASLTRRYLVELLKEGSHGSAALPVPNGSDQIQAAH